MKNRKKTVDLYVYVPDIENSKHVNSVLEIVIETS